MSRLIAFGDSFTFGQYLEDQGGWNRERLAWPTVLGAKLNLEVVNNAVPGFSNVEILATILDFKFKKDDLVIVGWTFVQRDVVFRKDTLFKIGEAGNFLLPIGGGNRKLSPWTNDPICKQWLNIYTDYDLGIKSGLHIHHAELYLDSIGVQQYHFLSHIQSYNPFEKSLKWIKKPKNLIKNLIFKRIDLALDNAHPGIKSHQQLADKLYDHITK